MDNLELLVTVEVEQLTVVQAVDYLVYFLIHLEIMVDQVMDMVLIILHLDQLDGKML
jgi:hypothetical protein